MNTRLGKSFGLAFVVAVGILAVMFALGTFNAQKAGAQGAGQVVAGTISIDPNDPVPGASTAVTVTFEAADAIGNYEDLEIVLEGFGIPSSIDVRDVQIRLYPSDPTVANPPQSTAAGLADDIAVSGDAITLTLNENDDLGTVAIAADQWASIVIRQRAGVTAPALAGKYDVEVGGEPKEEAVEVTATLDLDPEKGGGGTDITVTGKALANGTGSLYTTAGPVSGTDANSDGDFEDEDDIAAGERTFLKDIMIADGAFETEVAAEDLKKLIDDGNSNLVVVDSNGDEAYAVFKVTGTTTLGSDSIGKGKLLEITIADWITALPNNVKIGGTDHPIVDEDNDPYDVELDEGADTFYVKIDGEVRLGTKTVVLFNGEDRLDGASVEITSLDLSVSPSTAVPGQEITVEGTGFTSGSKLVTLTVGGVGQTKLSNRNDVIDYDVLSGGRIVISFKVPDGVTDGSKNIQVTDADSRVGEVSLTVPEPTISLNPDTSRRGTDVAVSGTGFPANSNITVDYGDNEPGIATGRSDATGNFTTSFGIPSDAAIGGDETVTASVTAGDTVYEAEATHAVPDKAITVTPEVARSGDTVMIVGTGFPRYSDVQVKIGDGDFRATNSRTDGVGDFTVSVIIPGIDSGTHVLQVDAGGSIATWVMTVPDAAVITTRPSGDVFADLIASNNLTVVWYFDNATKAWSFYDPRPEVAAAVDLTEVTSGDNVWIQVVADQMFQGEMLTGGWNLVTLN